MHTVFQSLELFMQLLPMNYMVSLIKYGTFSSCAAKKLFSLHAFTYVPRFFWVWQWSQSDWLMLPPPKPPGGLPLSSTYKHMHTHTHIFLLMSTNIEKAFICKTLLPAPLWDHLTEHLKVHIEQSERVRRIDSPLHHTASSHPNLSCLLKEMLRNKDKK